MAEDEEPGFSAQLICDDLECAKARAGRGGACHFALGGQFSTKTGRDSRDRGAAAADALGDIAPTRALPQLVFDSLVPAAILGTPFILADGLLDVGHAV
jgi:hypothetical protein